MQGLMKIRKIFASSLGIIVLSLFFIPVFVSAAEEAGTRGIVYSCAGECTFYDLVAATQKVLKWGTVFALGFSVVVIAWVGFNYMLYSDNPGKRKAATDSLVKVAIGIGFMLGAWLIVTLITSALGVDKIVTFPGEPSVQSK